MPRPWASTSTGPGRTSAPTPAACSRAAATRYCTRRSLEFDDLRPYVPGDDVRDIDWKASARSGGVLIKRFVAEKHHKILLVADAGRNMTALAPER